MPTPIANSASSWRVSLVALFLGGGLGAAALLLGLIVWRLAHLPRSDQPVVQQRPASIHPAATSHQKIAVEDGAGPRESINAAPATHLASAQVQRRPDTGREPVVVPSRLPAALTADQLFEQRLRVSEDDLRRALSAVPEVRLVSDGDFQNIRRDKEEFQKQITESAQANLQTLLDRQQAARSALDAVRARRGDYAEAERAFREISHTYQEAARTLQKSAPRNSRELQRFGYETNVRLHETMKRAAAQAGLRLGSGPICQLAAPVASEVAQLSKELRDNGFVTVPGATLLRAINGGGVSITAEGIQPSEEAVGENLAAFRSWCAQHRLENNSGAVRTLTQMLQIEDEATRLLLVEELTRSRSNGATAGLAMRALVDLSPAVRQAALAGLKRRPASQYVPLLLRGLRYPWPPVADHAAVALRSLHIDEAAASLVDLLDLPSPSTPVLNAKTNRHTVPELVRLNHLRNCLLCHAPSSNPEDGLVRGIVPTPGKPLPVQYYASQDGDFVRADTTFLRQDFSVNLPDKDAAPWPSEQRFDFVLRLRPVPPGERLDLAVSSANYPQRDAVLYALRGLTGKDGGGSSTRWRELLGLIAAKPTE